MKQSLRVRFGFDPEAIVERLQLTGLSTADSVQLGNDLQHQIVRPNIVEIIDSFYNTLGCNPQFVEIVQQHSDFDKLKKAQRHYLLSLGESINTPQYFEERLRIGAAHQRVGVSLGLYHCAYRLLQSILIDNLPKSTKSNPLAFQSMVQFIIKITALDMSLAIETYYADKVVTLQDSIDSMRGEGELLRNSLRTDSLTNLCSRDFSIEVLKAALASSQEEGRPLSVVMADLDRFKDVNDKYGHVIGDQVLAAVAARISCDARDTDTMGRYGGDEFLIILDNTGLADARQVAERIREEVGSNPVHVDDVTVPVTISLGATESCDNDDRKSLTRRADRALYAAKDAGRNRVEIGDAERSPQERRKPHADRQATAKRA